MRIKGRAKNSKIIQYISVYTILVICDLTSTYYALGDRLIQEEGRATEANIIVNLFNWGYTETTIYYIVLSIILASLFIYSEAKFRIVYPSSINTLKKRLRHYFFNNSFLKGILNIVGFFGIREGLIAKPIIVTNNLLIGYSIHSKDDNLLRSLARKYYNFCIYSEQNWGFQFAELIFILSFSILIFLFTKKYLKNNL